MINADARIAELQAEVKRLRALGRTKREPVGGIGGTIQMQRENREWGVRTLAKEAGLAAGMITRIESDPEANLKLSTLLKIAAALGTTGAELLREARM